LRYLRWLKIPQEDALDLVQEVLRIVATRIGNGTFHYDRGKSFRGWLRTVARNKAKRYFHDRKRKPPSPGGTDHLRNVQGLCDPNPTEEEQVIEKDWRARLLEIAVKRVQPRVKPKTWEAFIRTAVKGQQPATVAEQLGMSVGNVYVCKSKVIKMLREVVEEIDV
jgi:RNA polymerase sigma factor (sigma-70 family)